MKQSIGGSYLIYLISIFILIVFAFLCGILNYMKAFKVNSTIANSLENHSGYNGLAITEINNKLSSLGYRKASNTNCKEKSGKTLVEKSYNNTAMEHDVCIYEIDETPTDCSTIMSGSDVTADEISKCAGKFRYGIVTYVYLDLPFISEIKIPIYSESESIYLFEEWSKA